MRIILEEKDLKDPNGPLILENVRVFTSYQTPALADEIVYRKNNDPLLEYVMKSRDGNHQIWRLRLNGAWT